MPRPFIPVPNCVSVELIYGSFTVILENVLHVLLPAPASASDLVAVRNVFLAWDAATWVPRRTNATTLVRIRSKALDAPGAPFEDYSVIAGGHAGVKGNPCPLNVSFCIRLGTGLSGRSFRGRLYVPGVALGDTSPPGTFALAEANAIVAAISTLITNLAAATPSAKLVVVSYRSGSAWRAVGLATPVTSVSFYDLNLDSQRKRLPGRGI